MRDDLTLRQFQENLLSRLERARSENADEKIIFLGFGAGGKNYLIDGRDVLDVNQMTPIEPIPSAKPWAVGAANIKGSVHLVTDFSILLGGERTKRGKFMVLSPDLIVGAAILIDGISGLFDAKEVRDLTPVSGTGLPSWITGECSLSQKYFVVDTMKLVSDVSFSNLQSGVSQ